MSSKLSPEQELAALARLLAHPIRVKILDLLQERTGSPSELASEIGEPLTTVAYHFKLLAEQRALELVSTRQVRGALEHTYRVTPATRRELDGLQSWLGQRRRRRARPAKKVAKG